MRIYFCDKCNESIPLKDMQTNRITIDENKIYCSKCAPRPARARVLAKGLYSLALPALLCIGLGMVVMALWGEKIMSIRQPETVREQLQKFEVSVRDRLDRLEAGVKGVDTDLTESAGADGRMGKLGRVNQRLSDHDAAMQQLLHSFNSNKDEVQAQYDRLQAKTDAASTRLEDDMQKRGAVVDRLDRDSDKFRAEIEAIKARLDGIASTLATLEARPAVVSKAEPAPTPGPAPAPIGDAALSPAQEKKLDDSLKRLSEKEPNRRFGAVFDLADIKGPRVEKALAGVLSDPVDYVQTAAIGCLADLGARWTVMLIAPKLKDENQFIREAAIAALEKLTGLKLDVKEDSGAAKLSAKMKDVEKWWNENKAKIPGAENVK